MKYLDDIRNFYEDHDSRGDSGFCAVIGFVDIDGNSYIDKETTYCHAGLNFDDYMMDGVNVSELTEVLSVKFDSFDFIEDKNDKLFTKWLTEDSPWKDCFLSKDSTFEITNILFSFTILFLTFTE